MTSSMRSYLLLGATLLIGVVLGAVLVGALGQFRAGRIEGMRERDGFVRDIQRMIQPRDDAQRAELRPIIEATATRNRQIMGDFNNQMRAALADLVAELEPHLDDEQLARLRRFADRPPPPGGPGAPDGRGGRRPPPPKKR